MRSLPISPKLYEESLPVLGQDKVHFIPIGVAIPSAPEKERQAKRAAHGLSPNDIVLIFVGGICARKDPLFLVEQMPAVCKFSPQAKLIIVGPILESDHHARMLAYIEEHNLKDHVVFKGEVLDPYPFLQSPILWSSPHIWKVSAVPSRKVWLMDFLLSSGICPA
jgi:glycosyltransferase involved in cell wall biosynthesis